MFAYFLLVIVSFDSNTSAIDRLERLVSKWTAVFWVQLYTLFTHSHHCPIIQIAHWILQPSH